MSKSPFNLHNLHPSIQLQLSKQHKSLRITTSVEHEVRCRQQAALDLHNQGNPLSPSLYPATPIWLSHPARREAPEHNGQILCGITIWLAMLKPGHSKWPSQATSSIPQRGNGEDFAYFEPTGNRNYMQLRRLGLRRNSSTMPGADS